MAITDTHIEYLFLMIFLHIVDDYYLQGILAKMKQREWWVNELGEEKFESSIYKDDYIVALMEHAFSWAFMITLPALVVLGVTPWYIILLGANWFIHTLVDNMKANEHTINLAQDQLIHLVQICITWIILFLF